MEGWSRSRSRRESRSYNESEEAILAWDKLVKVREKMYEDLRTVTKVEEKIKDISKRLKKLSKWKSTRKRTKNLRQTFVKLKEMESKLIGIKNRFGLLISHWEIHGNRHVTYIDELRHKVNLIEVSAAQITELLQTFDDDIGQSSTQQQFMNSAPVILQFQAQQQQQFEAPDVEQFQALNINPNPDYVLITKEDKEVEARENIPSHVVTKEDKEVEAYIQHLREKIPSHVVEGEEHKRFENRLRLVGLEPGERYVDAISLLEIFSVTVHSSDENTCKIYGEILVRDELGNILSLYDRSEEDAELVNNAGELLLDMSICPAKPLTISVNLIDKIQCVSIAKGEFSLFYSSKEDFDEELWHVEVSGDSGYACVSYRSFRSAVVAEISVVLFNRLSDLDDLDVSKTPMYGTICTRLGALYRKYGHFNDETDDHILVHKNRDVPLSLSYEGIIELSKSRVVVPACSSLRVAMRLNACEDMSLIAYGTLEFYAKDDEHVRRDLLGENGKCQLAVEVKWSMGDHIFPQMKVIDQEIIRKHDIGLVEIFSFSVGCSSENINLHGRIQVCSNIDNFYIFEGDGDSPNEACVSWPKRRVLVVGNFRIKLNIRDSEGREICKGFVLPSEFASRRICSVVRGKYGCAAVHYAIIKDGMVATIIVKFFPNDSSHLNVFGSISTRYGDSEYKTYYDRTYYQSVLFKRSIEDPVTLVYGSQMPFIKCVVATPKNCSLIVEFDLKACDPKLLTVSELFLQNKATFEAFKRGPQKIVGQGFYVTVEVIWE